MKKKNKLMIKLFSRRQIIRVAKLVGVKVRFYHKTSTIRKRAIDAYRLTGVRK